MQDATPRAAGCSRGRRGPRRGWLGPQCEPPGKTVFWLAKFSPRARPRDPARPGPARNLKLDADLQPPCLEPEGARARGSGPKTGIRVQVPRFPIRCLLVRTGIPPSRCRKGSLARRRLRACRPLASGHRNGASRPGPPSPGRRPGRRNLKLNSATCAQGAGVTRPPNFQGPGYY